MSIHTNGPDCITGKCGYLEYGAGTEHGRSIMELLARIQVGDASHPAMEQILKEALESEGKGMTYVILDAGGDTDRDRPGVCLRRLCQDYGTDVISWEV